MNKVLLAQLQRAGVSPQEAPPALSHFFELVSQAYDAAEMGQRELREIIEELPSAVFVRRGAQIIFTNTTTVRALGYDEASQIIGRSVIDFIHPADRQRAMKASFEALGQRVAQRGAPEASIELRVARRDGTYAIFERTTVKDITFEGESAVLLVLNDVTEQKEMLRRLQVADRMASIGTLAAGVAHEINNPLAYVVANLGYLEEALDRRRSRQSVDWEEFGKAVADASAGASRVRQIVSSLKTFSRGDEERYGPVDLAEVLRSAVEMCWNELRHRARLVLEPSNVPPVEGNAVRLGQVFVNLLVNAAQAIPDGAADDNEIRVTATRAESGRIVVTVSDTGCGMTPEVMAHIFEPFFTTKPIGVGTGLGLAICHGIVASMGGELEVESEPGRGTTFRLILQPARRPATLPPLAPATAGVPGARARVLVVDDEAAVGAVVRRLLGREHEVISVTSGREALTRLAGGEDFDVIACDLMMPDVSGMDFYEEVVKTFPDSADRVFFMTGGTFTPRAQAFLERTGLRRLDKPFDSESLRETVRTIAARR